MIPVSLLPFPLLHVLSRLTYFVLYRIAGYRKKVVRTNLANSFPEKTEAERKKIEKGFYRFLGDLLLEGFKPFTIPFRKMRKHLVANDLSLLNKFAAEGKSVVIAIGHFNSWEMFLAGCNSFFDHQAVVLYRPLTNKFFDRKVNDSRSRFGTILVPADKTKEFFRQQHPKPTATFFAIDQSPAKDSKCYWMNFLNQETGVMFGTEKFAKDFDQPVFYARINKIKRGYYSLDMILITDKPKETAYGEITEKVTRQLESDIRKNPESWLWSHKRWKYKR
jgi:KDO2-lipid IV(A) lauroyltransferase